MSQVMDPAAPVEVELRPAPPLDMRRAVRLGLAGGAAMVLVAATGIVATFQPRLVIDPIVPLGILFLYLLAFGFGWMAGQPPATLEGYEPATAGAQNVLAGALAGLLAGLSLGLFLIAITVFDLRGVFINMSPELAEILGFGLPVAAASVRDRAGVGVYGRPGRGDPSPQQTCPPDSDRGAHRRDRVLPAHRPVRPAIRRTESGVGHRLPLYRAGRRPHHHRISGHFRRVHRPVLVDGGAGQHPPAAGSGDAQGPTLPLADRDGPDNPGDPVFRAEDHGPIRQPDPGHCRHLSPDGAGPEHRGWLRRVARFGLRGLLRSGGLHHCHPHLAAITRVHSRDLGARLTPLRDDCGSRGRLTGRHPGHTNAWRLSGHRHPGIR